MSLPNNITCDITRAGAGSPAATAVPALLMARFRQGLEAGQGLADASQRFTHIALLAPNVDIRDAYLSSDPDILATAADPDVAFTVVFVERRLRGTDLDHLRVYLSRRPASIGVG